MQLLAIVNDMLRGSPGAASRLLQARHYAVVPIGYCAGLIQWVDDTVPVFGLFKQWQHREARAMAATAAAKGQRVPRSKHVESSSEAFFAKFVPAAEQFLSAAKRRQQPPPAVERAPLPPTES